MVMTSKQEASTTIDCGNDEKLAESTVATTKTDKPTAETIKRAPISNYWRVLSFGNGRDHALLLVGMCCAAGSGVALPLMNIVFGNLVGSFNTYFIPGTTTTKAEFLHSASQNALRIVYLFIGRFVLTYVGAVSFKECLVASTDDYSSVFGPEDFEYPQH